MNKVSTSELSSMMRCWKAQDMSKGLLSCIALSNTCTCQTRRANQIYCLLSQRPGAAGGGGGEGGGPLDFLRKQPRFETLRVLVQQSPGLLNPLLQVSLSDEKVYLLSYCLPLLI